MKFSQDEGLGWTAVTLLIFGTLIVVINAVDTDFWFFAALNAIPMVFGLILLIGGASVLITQLSGSRAADGKKR